MARRYTVLLEPTNEPDQPGWFYAHVPALDLTTHGLGVEGALAAARELVTGWVAERQSRGEEVLEESAGLVGQIEIPDDAVRAA